MGRKIRPLSFEIDEELWKKYKEKVPRTITLNDAVIELIRKVVNKK